MGGLLVNGETMRVYGEEQFVMDGWIDLAPFEQLLGMCIVEAVDGRAVLTMPFTVKLCQGGGFMHGGALTALADTAAAMAVKTRLSASTPFATRDLSIRFFAPVRQGIVTATAILEQVDERRFSIHVGLTDSEDVKVAEFLADFRLLRGT
ncbi:MAG: PaaI family thioesterase [Pedobacter sp.]